MAEVNKIEGGVLVECDCGLVHKIQMIENKLRLKTTYSKERKINNGQEAKDPAGNHSSELESESIWF